MTTRKKTIKKTAKKTTLMKNEIPTCVRSIRDTAADINRIEIPAVINERFKPQVSRVVARLNKIANNMEKAIMLDATKEERESKKTKRVAAREKKLLEQLARIQVRLKALKD